MKINQDMNVIFYPVDSDLSGFIIFYDTGYKCIKFVLFIQGDSLLMVFGTEDDMKVIACFAHGANIII